MVELKLEIGNVTFVETTYGNYLDGTIKDVSIDYINQSTDYWNSSYSVSTEVDKEKAIQIIEFLQKAFEL